MSSPLIQLTIVSKDAMNNTKFYTQAADIHRIIPHKMFTESVMIGKTKETDCSLIALSASGTPIQIVKELPERIKELIDQANGQ